MTDIINHSKYRTIKSNNESLIVHHQANIS